MNADDRRTRLIAFVIITLVFVASVGALLYWAINEATVRTSTSVTAHFDAIGVSNTTYLQRKEPAVRTFIAVWKL